MRYKKIGIIGDVHCEDKMLLKGIDLLKTKQPEAIFCTGDIADGNGDFDLCIQILRQNNIITVLGNHDRWLSNCSMRDLSHATQFESVDSSSLHYLNELPSTYIIHSCIGEILLSHGLGDNDMAQLTPDDYGYALEVNMDLQKILSEQKYPMVIGGHTHKRMVRAISGCNFINAGSLISSIDPCTTIVDFHSKNIEFNVLTNSGNIYYTENIKFS